MLPPSSRRPWCIFLFLALAWLTVSPTIAFPHDIPNQRVDRSIQVTVGPSRLTIDYEVSLSELTLTQELRALTGNLPGGDRSAWLDRYARVTAPMDAKGFSVIVDGQPIEVVGRKFDLVVEEHPRFTFHFEAAIPNRGTLAVRDRNYVSSEGTSRLAVRGVGGVRVTGDELPDEVDQIPVRPVWQLTDAEERRTKQVEVRFQNKETAVADTTTPVSADGDAIDPGRAFRPPYALDAPIASHSYRIVRLSELLDQTTTGSWFFLSVLSLTLGAAHAIQPGHGKTLVTAAALGPGSRLYQPILLGLATTATHLGSVLIVAVALWITGGTRVATFHEGLTRIAGFTIAATGLWRVGRCLGGYSTHESEMHHSGGTSNIEVLGLGVAGGLVPCWDAVAMVVLATALGRLGEGVALVVAFSAGMALVLVTTGWFAWKFKSKTFGLNGDRKWQHRLELGCGVILSVPGLYLFLRA